MKLDNFFFNGVLADKPVDGDGPGLANAVSPVGRLILNGWIPPGVHVDDVISRSQVQSQPAGLEADEKEIALAGLKLINLLFALGAVGGAVQIFVGNALSIQILTQNLQMADKLAEHQGLMATAQEFLNDGREYLKFGAGKMG